MRSSDGSLGICVDCENAEAFQHRVQAFEVVCSSRSIFIKYVNDTWLIHTKKNLLRHGRIG